MWKAQSVQAALFVASSEGIKADAVFEHLWNVEPENITRNKIPRSDNPFLSTASGSVSGKVAEVQVQPGRVDVYVYAPQTTEPGFPVIEVPETTVDLATRISKQTVVSSSIVRMALVTNLLIPSDSLDSSNSIIFKLIGFDPGFAGTDLNFQFNSRQPFVFDKSLSMNRLLRYNSVSMQQFALTVGQNTVATGAPLFHGVSLMIDVNTVPDGRVIETKHSIAIFDELCKEALRIAQTGELQSLRNA